MLENLFWLGLVGGIIALIFAVVQAKKVLKFSEGTELMQKLAASIRKGANAYLKRQYTTVAKIFIVVFVILLILAWVGLLDNWFIPFAFVTGGIYSALAGFIGMKIATSANARTANAAHESLNRGLNVAFSSGAVMGFTVVGLGLLDVSIWFHILKYIAGFPAEKIAQTMVMFGMGASFMALFGRVGGGIFTKAADVGADLVGKVEAGIPEDDPRNPATIADNVGDNVGDVAGMGADLYESYVGSILATFALGATAYSASGMTWNAMLLPLVIAVVGVVCSVLGTFLIRTKEDATQKSLLATLRKGTYTAAVLAAIIAAPVTYFIMGSWGPYIAILAGLVAGCAIGYFTEYYTSDTYKPPRKVRIRFFSLLEVTVTPNQAFSRVVENTISSGRLVKNRYWCCGFSVILSNICSRHSVFQWEKSLMPVSRKFCGRFFSISRSLFGKNSGFSKSSIM